MCLWPGCLMKIIRLMVIALGNLGNDFIGFFLWFFLCCDESGVKFKVEFTISFLDFFFL